MIKGSRDLKLLMPLLALLFCALAFLAASFIAGESRKAQILVEYEADRIASGLVESFRASASGGSETGGGRAPGIDARILGFGLYLTDGSIVAGIGDAPASLSVSESASAFRYDDDRRSLSLVRLLGMGGMRGAGMRDMMPRQGARGRGSGSAGGGAGFLYLSMDISDFYQRRGLYTAATFLVPLAIAGLAAVFISLLASNLRYRRSAQERETLARLGESARTLAHEIRNPLSAIRIQTGILRKRMPEGMSRELDAIDEEAERLNALSRRVGDFLKNPAGKPERVDLREFLGDLARRSPYDTSFSAPGEPEIVLFDPELLRSAVENLLRNARESYGEGSGAVEMELSGEEPRKDPRHRRVSIAVRDRGKGIPADCLDKVFDPFFTDKVQGSGIGLPLARRFVEAAGGSLSLSPRQGGGLEARICLPVAEGA